MNSAQLYQNVPLIHLFMRRTFDLVVVDEGKYGIVPQIGISCFTWKTYRRLRDFLHYLQIAMQIMNSFANGLGKIYFTIAWGLFESV